MTTQTTHAAIYEQHRSYLFGLAYRMLGTASDAEDVVQEAFLRWQQSGKEHLQSPKAYLTTIVSRLAMDTLKSARAKRETYVGQWLPEPLLTETADDAGTVVALNESLSLAFLTLLERLNPVERAVFLLHDVFGYSFDEIAGIVERTPAACRKAAQRARERIHDDRPRYAPSPEEQDRLTSQFLAACTTGDVPALVELLAEDVTVWGDGGGVVSAVAQPISGATQVARFLVGIVRLLPENALIRRATINGGPALIALDGDRLIGVVSLEIDDGRIRRIRNVINPEKLHAVERALRGLSQVNGVR
ncbi:MAG TPA: sigma-70 family RNA polymerase sigma factor [Thermomicrobiales bacterium]|nr:sigma-70 family RNA polymerase sigma factor [Thermomicrobiales bacterium]